MELVDFQGSGEDRVGQALRRGAPISCVELDPEVLIRPTGIVTGREDEATLGAVFSNQTGSRRRGEERSLAHQKSAHPVRRSHLDDDLRGLSVVVAPVSTQHQRDATCVAKRIKHGLHEILEVMRLENDLDLLAQARGAGFLICVGMRFYRFYLHDRDLGSNVSLMGIVLNPVLSARSPNWRNGTLAMIRTWANQGEFGQIVSRARKTGDIATNCVKIILESLANSRQT